MAKFRHDQARQVFLCGSGSIESLPAEIESLGVRSVCLIGSHRSLTSTAGAATRIALASTEIIHEFDTVRPHARIANTEQIAHALVAEPPDAIIAVGGGSASDTAKGLVILLAEGFPLAEHCSTFTPPNRLSQVELRQPKIPVISVPTTLSGAEVTPGGGATDSNDIKRVFWDPKVASRVVVFDSDLVAETPTMLLAQTGMNGLAHCAEALYSKAASPLSSGLALEGARLFASSLPKLATSTGTTRRQTLDDALAAACIGGMVISTARVGLHHAICHVLGAAFGIPHGVANSVMLPYVLEFNHDCTADAQRLLAGALAEGLDADPALGAARLVALVQERTGVPPTLESAGLRQENLAAVAAGVMQDRGLFFNPKRVADASAILDLLRRAWSGQLQVTP